MSPLYRANVSVARVLSQSAVHVVVGKGGVGKTTVAATLALIAAGYGARVELVELEGRPELRGWFGSPGPLGKDPTVLYESSTGGVVRARYVAPDAALADWLKDHGFGRLLGRLVATGALDIVATAVPGIREVLILGRIKALSREHDGPVIVDAPATGHSVSLLAAPSALAGAARGGTLRHQAEDADRMVRDPTRCQVVLVTQPAELPVAEVVDAAYALEDRAGVALAGVVVNRDEIAPTELRTALAPTVASAYDGGLVAAMEAARAFALTADDERRRQRARLAEQLPLPQWSMPSAPETATGLDALTVLAAALEGARS